ncbi:McKusick-Kaufman/Bardet-Biedl syndromes putative chaperonin-like [Acanthaster planci]|uniref:McKusick-Kaufman/Bardet-Biedl syndromes putative chaperonin-like n=1 Tax=Acanthaster planci TaxID=133434 RepID=A0A8B7YPJ6_ACAPL|nr:McKusick-Kaufman/Bardet-Biedl syndromes putative chaperonin-like [Acanthaster planci]XP_022094593.1 McKusick-Kaufman/Bardet-Biedl syndromes putative chaperonin-like [Acanthaster planci]XP_022094594.1 McKusick-Kaufman/Bardet-Biedl syndromes putative chaperonin-like [Acanthaster planci]XP_022094595.1 McKusick-Kaufman/Bardet-Biedl syndromes putative chaperonin-like [Acanthaster planci]XP_022094596.1 McKusick-Kaufman/Bardet-Biedl syndromes putative chaperonin-like [Acanthaster planci]XP_0220945
MSAMSPGAPHTQRQETSKIVQRLSNTDVTEALETFRFLILSCYGPAGHLKTIQNSCGGPVTVTSSSSVLVRQLCPSRPILRLMSAAVEGHLASCSDGGLFCALLMTNLVQTCSSLHLHPILCIGVNELMLKACTDYLNSDDSCRVSVDVGDLPTMLSLVRSVICTKPTCGLFPRETDLICNLSLQAFLQGLWPSGPTLSIPTVRYILIEGKTPMNSCIMEGVLLESPQIPLYARRPFTPPELVDGSIRVAVFNTSLAGGGEGFPDIHLEARQGVTVDAATRDCLLALGSCLVQQRVGLLACQKVIHPCLKHFLRSHGVLTIDRLSLVHIDTVQMVTGAQLLGAVQPTIPEDALGRVEEVSHCVMYGKSYIRLLNRSRPVCSFVLCNRTESALEELKTACRAAHHVLSLTLSRPLALPGAGCFEACLAAHLKQQIKTLESDVLDKVGCSPLQFQEAAGNFIYCVELVARALEHGQDSQVTDDVHHHRWPLPLNQSPTDWLGQCACGMKSFQADSDWQLLGSRRPTEAGSQQSGRLKQSKTRSQQTCKLERREKGQSCKKQSPDLPISGARKHFVLDSFAVKLNALHVAVETANVVLRISQTIEDSNL